MLMVECASAMPPSAPTMDSGSDSMMVKGCRKLSNCAASTRYTMMMAEHQGPNQVGKRLSHDVAHAGPVGVHAGGDHLLGFRLDLVMRCPKVCRLPDWRRQ